MGGGMVLADRPNFSLDFKVTAHWRSLFLENMGGEMVLADRPNFSLDFKLTAH